MLTVFMTVLTPMADNFVISNAVCKADEVIHIRPSNWPDVSPVYSSYYDDVDGVLYIYGCVSLNTLEVRVLHNGLVLQDYIQPGLAPTIYNFNGWEAGVYRVTLSIDSVIFSTFSFEID